MLTYFLIGAAIGALTGVPIGPVNVAVIDAAYRHCLRRAIAVGFGGCIGDGIYAGVGIFGIAPLLEKNPNLPPILYGFSGIVLLMYGLWTVRARPVKTVSGVEAQPENKKSQHVVTGFIIGFALIVLNPAAIVTWVVIVGPFMSGVTAMEGLMAVLGISAGSFCWFTFVAYLADHGKKVLGDRAVWITRIVGYLLIGYGCYSLGRAGYLVYMLTPFSG